ncbi:hypothetical protein AAC387_Pa01g1740 [Persea americana]
MRPPTSSIVDESIVFGREADKAKLVRLLTSDDSLASDSGMQVVPICGMGGLGKTTLAQLIHNDERVMNHFDVSVWVYVSEDFDLIRLTKAIAEFVLPGSAPLLTSLDRIQVSVQNALEGKKFFLVLDDVWNVNCNSWVALRAPLMVAGRGSRILVTTRSHRVSSMMGTVPTHSLRCLSDDDCWSIFKRLAFVEGDSDVHPDLVMIGKEIVNKCKGLPLAVNTLGGLLRSKVNVVDWKSILQSEIWDLAEERDGILPTLRLSYRHLPAHLKRCFEFCSIFPKGSYFYVDELVWSWMAQGFIQSGGSKDMEDIGMEYLADLVSRLPKSITRLYNLQTLDLTYCSKLVEVPSDFSNLVNLRKIISYGCSASIPFGGLKSFQEHFKVGREIGYRVNELRDMIHLRGSLRISELENVGSVEEAKEAELKNKQKISHLTLEWESHDVDSRLEGIEEEVLNALQPHTNLKELNIRGYCGVRFATWLWDSSFSKLVSISLDTCKCHSLALGGAAEKTRPLFNLLDLEIFPLSRSHPHPSMCLQTDSNGDCSSLIKQQNIADLLFSSALQQIPPAFLLLRRWHSPQFLQSSDVSANVGSFAGA